MKCCQCWGGRCHFCKRFVLLFVSWNSLSTISTFALISAGAEDTDCPSLSVGLQSPGGIWGHCEPLCRRAGSAAQRSLPAFTGFPVSGYHVLCLFSLLFVCVHPIGFNTPTTTTTTRKGLRRRGWHYLCRWGGVSGVVNMHLHNCWGEGGGSHL